MTNCINNIINSRNADSYNPAALNLFKKEKSSSRYIEAPKILPKYSMYEELRKEDEFRKSVIAESSLKQSRQKASVKLLFVASAAILAGITAMIKKK